MFLRVSMHGKPEYINLSLLESVSHGEKKGTLELAMVSGRIIVCDSPRTLDAFMDDIGE